MREVNYDLDMFRDIRGGDPGTRRIDTADPQEQRSEGAAVDPAGAKTEGRWMMKIALICFHIAGFFLIGLCVGDMVIIAFSNPAMTPQQLLLSFWQHYLICIIGLFVAYIAINIKIGDKPGGG